MIWITLFLRFLWQWFPSLWACLLFWSMVAVWEVRIIRDSPDKINWWSKTCSLAGTAMNAAVTIANDGRMPFFGKIKPYSIWVLGTGKHLLFFCDRFPALGMIFSIGDFFLIGSIVLIFVFPLKSDVSSSS